jgi:hypothetical protein
VPSAEMQTVGTLVNLRVLPRVARVRHHTLATDLCSCNTQCTWSARC